MNQLRLFRKDFRGVMIHDEPIRFVQTRFETQICHPGSCFPWFPLAPGIIMVGFQPSFLTEELARQSLQENSRHQPVQITFVGQNYVRAGQRLHVNTIGLLEGLCQNGMRGRQTRQPVASLVSWTKRYLCTRAPPPFMSFSTSDKVAIEVSPGVVMASAPCAAPYSTANFGSPVLIKP